MDMERTCIDTIPVEIWDKIFLHAIPSPIRDLVDPDNASQVLRTNILLSITHTCARWRDIALSRPLLWNTISVYIHGDTQTPNQHLVDRMIEYSANEPLSMNLFMVDVDETTATYPTSALNRSLTKLFKYITRWKDFGLYLRGCSLPLPLHQQLNTIGAPSLESLRLDAILGPRESDALLSLLWRRSPQAHKILLSVANHESSRFYGYQVPPTLPYDRITSLYIHSTMSNFTSISISIVVSTLHNAPNLVSCVISNIKVYHGSSVTEMKRSKPLTRLEYLHLGDCPPSRELPSELPLTVALDYITAPSLKVLALSNMFIWGQDEFERFITRSRCSLEEIHFFNPNDLDASILVAILQGNPSLKGLHIGCLKSLLDEPLFAHYMVDWNSTLNEFEVCPNLSWLSFHDPTAFDMEPDCDLDRSRADMLAQILAARLNPPKGGRKIFEKLYIPFDNLSMSSYDPIRALYHDPFALDVRSDHEEIISNIHDLWERYGDK